MASRSQPSGNGAARKGGASTQSAEKASRRTRGRAVTPPAGRTGENAVGRGKRTRKTVSGRLATKTTVNLNPAASLRSGSRASAESRTIEEAPKPPKIDTTTVTDALHRVLAEAQGTMRSAAGNARLDKLMGAYREALYAELERTLIPAVMERIVRGAAALPPSELARQMLAITPAPAPVNKMAEQIGPVFYDTNGVMVVLTQPGEGPVSKQAVEQRRKRNTLLALQTSNKRWIYPVWQFKDHAVMPGLADVLDVFEGQPSWSVATWLTTPSADFDGKTAVELLTRDPGSEDVLRIARHTAARWAA